MRNHILTIVNLLLLATCGYCVWYLSTQEYHEPAAFKDARRYLDGGERPTPSSTPSVVPTNDSNISTPAVPPVAHPPTPTATPIPTPVVPEKPLFVAIVTPLPTPTPTPVPTPPPPDLGTAALRLTIKGINSATEVEFADRGAGEGGTEGAPFTLTVGGPPHEVMDKDNRPVPVSLISVDLDTNVATLGYQNQRTRKPMTE